MDDSRSTAVICCNTSESQSESASGEVAAALALDSLPCPSLALSILTQGLLS